MAVCSPARRRAHFVWLHNFANVVVNRGQSRRNLLRTVACQRSDVSPVCVACNTIITVKHSLIQCADLLEVRKQYFEEKSLYSLLRDVNPEKSFDYLKEIGMFYKG